MAEEEEQGIHMTDHLDPISRSKGSSTRCRLEI